MLFPSISNGCYTKTWGHFSSEPQMHNFTTLFYMFYIFKLLEQEEMLLYISFFTQHKEYIISTQCDCLNTLCDRKIKGSEKKTATVCCRTCRDDSESTNRILYF